MPEARKNPRCLSCGFLNPEDADFCGNCGSRLLPEKTRPKRKTKADYDESIISGDIHQAADYGYSVWLSESWKLLGILILGCLFISIPIFVLVLSHDRPQKFFFLFLTYVAVAFVLATLAGINLDLIRGGPVRLSRGIITGISRLLPACLMLLWVVAGSILTAGLVWLWYVPQMIIDRYEHSELLSGYASGLIAVWLIVAFLFLVVPFVLIWLAGFWIGMCRVVDRGTPSWDALGWTLARLFENPWEIFKVAFKQLWIQFIGVAFCWVGVLYTLGMSNAALTGVYEWLKYHEVRRSVFS
jgi:ribosomal protein L40E